MVNGHMVYVHDLEFWAVVNAVGSAVRCLVCAVESIGSDKLKKYSYYNRVVAMAMAGEVTQLSPSPYSMEVK
jgi:hypothetical protein